MDRVELIRRLQGRVEQYRRLAAMTDDASKAEALMHKADAVSAEIERILADSKTPRSIE